MQSARRNGTGWLHQLVCIRVIKYEIQAIFVGQWINLMCFCRCGNVNFARRTSCNRCGRGESLKLHVKMIWSCITFTYSSRQLLDLNHYVSTEKTTEAKMMKAGGTEIGKTLAEKSRGLFSANDWQCKTYVILPSIFCFAFSSTHVIIKKC